MTDQLVYIHVPFAAVLPLLKHGFTIYKGSYNAKQNDSPSYLIWIDGANTKASAHGMCFGEYVGEPRFDCAIYLLKDGVLKHWSPLQEDLYATDYYFKCLPEKREHYEKMIKPLLPYGTLFNIPFNKDI